EVRDEQNVGDPGFDHLDRRPEASALGQRQLAGHVDLAEDLDELAALSFGVLAELVGLNVRGAELVAVPVALFADTGDPDDSTGSHDWYYTRASGRSYVKPVGGAPVPADPHATMTPMHLT